MVNFAAETQLPNYSHSYIHLQCNYTIHKRLFADYIASIINLIVYISIHFADGYVYILYRCMIPVYYKTMGTVSVTNVGSFYYLQLLVEYTNL